MHDADQSAGKTNIRICALIALSFLWTGCGYLTWMYRLTDYYGGLSVDLMTEVIGYIFQAAGVLLFALGEKRSHYIIRNQYSFMMLTAAGYILCCLSSLSPSGPVALIFGYGMNLVFGMIAAYYITILSVFVRPSKAGTVFGCGYAISSIASFLISLPADGTFLRNPWVILIYLIAAAASVYISFKIRQNAEGSVRADFAGQESTASASGHGITSHSAAASEGNSVSASLMWLAGISILLLSCVKGAGFFFPNSDLSGYNISLEFSRSFYAAGLIIAGFINDRKRAAGAVLCIAALVFPFFSLAAGESGSINYLLWILGYAFFGFYAVYRVLIFVDIAGSESRLLYLAPMGLMWGRIGDAAGSLSGILLINNTIALISATALLFVICILLFFNLYHIMYMEPATPRDDVRLFASEYDLSQRELDILRQVLAGSSNKEIAENLFISENTVKFHMRNLLRKTGCARRKDLQALYDSYLSRTGQ